ncbi:hypothetical protein [Flavobacterium sp. HJSW_4]|uniref:hypothetical protein n=1 Tax=Flavobacterium sp. HJSW_4 TaxID=3344660 RepID=UPI0035F23FDB
MAFEFDKPLEIIVGMITILSTLVGTHIWAYKYGLKQSARDFKLKSIENKYVLIYAPLRKLLLNKHLATGIAILYPRFSQRFKRAKPYFISFNFKEGHKKLFDKYGNKPVTEIEYGGSFPLVEMQEIIQDNIMWADKKLVGLLQDADRSGYEQYYSQGHKDDTLLTEEENQLCDYIFDQYDKLNKKFISR